MARADRKPGVKRAGRSVCMPHLVPICFSGSKRARWDACGQGEKTVGNKNAFRHGHYSAEAIARRRELSELIRIARDTLAELE